VGRGTVVDMRVPTWSVPILLSMPAAACGGDDLTLPGPGIPAALRIVAGDQQRGLLGEDLTEPLVVQLVDVEGLPVEGRAVEFQFTDDVPDASIDPASVPTDADGHAAVRARLGRRAGSQAIEALVPAQGEDLRVRFQLTALRPDDGEPAPAPPPDDGNGGGGGTGGGGDGGGGGADDGGGGGHGNGNGNGNGHGHGHD
jgi:uncharacterized membrane protein YgcG